MPKGQKSKTTTSPEKATIINSPCVCIHKSYLMKIN